MDNRTLKSTSRRSAITDDIVLRTTEITRLIFRPIIVDNEKEKAASVKGTFIFQRKGKGDSWVDSEAIPLSGLKKGEGYKLEIKSSELLNLFNELRALYDLYEKAGIPIGETRFVKANKTVQAVAEMSDEELTAVVSGSQSLGAQALARIIRWASDTKNFSLMFERLESLERDSLVNLNAAVGISKFRRTLKDWSDNRDNSDEEFWQRLLSHQTFVLEQIFHLPIVIIKSKAYMGGKTVLNKGGKIVDFLVKNKITKAIGLIEIKTPKSPLLGTEYRDDIWNVSSELSGAVIQVLNYRESLSRDRAALLEGIDAEAFDPKCFVIIGHARRQLTDKNKQQSFELFRRQFNDVEIITYDELFDQTKRLVDILEGVTA